MSEPNHGWGRRSRTVGSALLPGTPLRWANELRQRWREDWECGKVLYAGYVLVMLGAPVLACRLGGFGWGRGVALVCGVIFFFFGYDHGLGLFSLLLHQLVCIGIMAQFYCYQQLAK